MADGRMIPVTTVSNPMTARILAAHLGAEGIVWQLQGGPDGMYPVGPVVVLVDEDDVETARELLAGLAGDEAEWQSGARSRRRARWAMAALLVGVLAAAILGHLADAAL